MPDTTSPRSAPPAASHEATALCKHCGKAIGPRAKRVVVGNSPYHRLFGSFGYVHARCYKDYDDA